MLTPQEVAQQSFTKASFGGYNMSMVDDFLDTVTKDYEALFNENALLKQKLGVLSTKLREYQSTEEAMRKTLLAAQQMADTMKKDTEAQCAQMLAEATNRSTTLKQEVEQGLAGESAKLQAAKASVEQYKAQIKAVCQQQMLYLDQLDQMAPPPVDGRSQMERTVEDIQAAVERSVALEEEEARRSAPAAEEAPAPAAEEAAPVVEPPVEQSPIPEPVAEPSAAPSMTPPAATHHAPPPVVEESSVSLYEQLMAQRKAATPPDTDPTAPTRRVDGKSLEFGKDFRIE